MGEVGFDREALLVLTVVLLVGYWGGAYSAEVYRVNLQKVLNEYVCPLSSLRFEYWMEGAGQGLFEDRNWSREKEESSWLANKTVSMPFFCPQPFQTLKVDRVGCAYGYGMICGMKPNEYGRPLENNKDTLAPIVLPRIVYNLSAVPLPSPSPMPAPFVLKDRIYYVLGQKFVVESNCDNVPKCDSGCCGGLAWAGEERDPQIWILNNNYSREWYYRVCAHERLHLRLQSTNESLIEEIRKREADMNWMDVVCEEFLEVARVK